jgi:hypothetical protein
VDVQAFSTVVRPNPGNEGSGVSNADDHCR